MIRKLLPILGITFIDIVGFSMLIPLLPYFVTHYGMAPVVVGLLASVFSLCQLISGPIWGNVSDRIGRKRVLIISQVGATIGWTMLAFAGNIFWVFFARIVEGVSGGNIGVTQAYVADLSEPKDRARAFGLIGAMFGAGMFFGPAGAGIIFQLVKTATNSPDKAFSAVFLAAAALQIVTLLLTVFLLPESRSKQEEEESKVGASEIFGTLSNPRLSPVLLEKFALSLAQYGWYLVIALYLKGQLGFDFVDTTRYFSIFAFFSVIMNVFGVGGVSKRIGDGRMATLGLGLLVVAFACIPFVHNTLEFAGLMILFATGNTYAANGITAQISNAASEREQGTVLGVSSSLDSLSGIIAPPISTGILTRYGSPFAGIESLVMAAISLTLSIRNNLAHGPVTTDVATEPVAETLEEPEPA
jgi:DHA1 family tetracycline resistance protein-like MFS transporter